MGSGDDSKAGFFINTFIKNEFVEKEIMNILKSDKISVSEGTLEVIE